VVKLKIIHTEVSDELYELFIKKCRFVGQPPEKILRDFMWRFIKGRA